MISLPQKGEYHSFYQPYINQLEGKDVLECMRLQPAEIFEVLGSVSEEVANKAYAEGKWTLKELLNHMNDTERIFSFRALAFARGDQQALPGMDQNEYQANSIVDQRTFQSLLEEFKVLRQASLFLFENLNEEQLMREGIASGNKVTVRALATMVVGHAAHHLQIIKERYL